MHISSQYLLPASVCRHGIRSKRPKTKMSQAICQNVPFFCESKRPKYIFTIFSQTRDSKHFLSQSQNVPSQNVPKSKRPKSKRPRVKTSQVKCPKVKTSQVKTSQSQNVPSQNVPESKRPRVKTSQVKTSQSQNVPSQNVPSCKQHYSVMKFFIS